MRVFEPLTAPIGAILLSKGTCDWYQATLDRRYWRVYHSECEDSLSRDGEIMWNGVAWASENEKIMSYPKCVIDNFGCLVPV